MSWRRHRRKPVLQLSGDTVRQAATSNEVRNLKRENLDMKEALADLLLENRLLKKNMNMNHRRDEVRGDDDL